MTNDNTRPAEVLGRIVLARPVGQKRRQRILVTNTYTADGLLTGSLVSKDGRNDRGGAVAYLDDVEAVEAVEATPGVPDMAHVHGLAEKLHGCPVCAERVEVAK